MRHPLLLLALAALLAACAPAAPAPSANPQAAQITFGNAGSDSGAVVRVLERFNKAQSDIVVTVRALNDYGDTGLASAAASTDCFDFYRPPEIGEDTSPLLDLGPLIAADAGFPHDDYPKALLAQYQRDGKQFALPNSVYFRMLAYNPALFDAAKRPYPNANWSFDDLRAAALALTGGQESARTYGWALVYDNVALQASTFAQRTGASLTRGSSDTLAPNFTDPRALAAVHTYVEMMRAASPPNGSLDYTSEAYANTANDLTFEGRIGMWVSQLIPMKSAGSAATKYAVAIAPLPRRPQEMALPKFSSSGLFISARTKHPDACWAWMQYLEAQPDGVTSAFPARHTVAASPQFAALVPDGAGAVYASFVAALEHAPARATTPSVWDAPMTGIWLTKALDRALKGENLEDALADAQFKTEQYMACVRGGEATETCAKQVEP